VNPLKVVDADQDRSGGGQDPQHIGDREADQAGLLGPPHGISPTKSDLDRAAARTRQVRERGEHRWHVEERGEYGESDILLSGASGPLANSVDHVLFHQNTNLFGQIGSGRQFRYALADDTPFRHVTLTFADEVLVR